ncbi:thymidine phosphorylase [Gynuella sunshinyii]|uniref:Thymidine phosphorylase n=1 Tax=Gynuella sunshinyii YC6258 TaxID=1445510 RepID=A0A0C5VEQ3_9GAMM|nr:thymidine phosphorylase [Gynuella sunshinyii]AJQ93052.1 thymidine phosphorylase [Gynuella sunshinyii YC6258]
MFIPQEFIRAKRDQQSLVKADIDAFVQGITDGTVTEAQIAAFAMAVYFNGLSLEETANLTLAMRDSGDTMQWDLPGPVLDKHSTGGVGDMVSLMLGPIVAACGAYVPMITGRGLGHSGGTLDKLESIPGFNAKPDNDLFRKCVTELGVCIIGQTQRLAPADQRFYATRDVTATVESVRLITASILSKKLSEGLDGLVMDVKFGNGAFMSDIGQGMELAESIVAVARQAGVKTHAVLTDMSSPLAWTAGNAVEIRETIDFLRNENVNQGLKQVTMTLAAEMLLAGNLVQSREEGFTKAEQALASGKALELFARMVTRLGGPADFIERRENYLPQAAVVKPVLAEQAGVVSAYDTRAVGMGVVALGGGRVRSQDPINHSVGYADILEIGTTVNAGDPLVTILASDEASWEDAKRRFLAAVTLTQESGIKRVDRINTIID